MKIDQDHGRFRQIVRGKVRQNLRKYISTGELIGRKAGGVDGQSAPRSKAIGHELSVPAASWLRAVIASARARPQ